MELDAQEAPTTRRGVNHTLVRLVGAALFFDFLLVTIVIPIVPALFEKEHYKAGILFAAKPASQAVFNLIAAGLFDDLDALVIGTVWGGAGAMLFGMAPQSFGLLLLARLLQGAASALVLTGGMSLIVNTHEPERVGEASSGALLGLSLGVSVGPLLGGPMYEALGRRDSFLLVGVPILMLGVAPQQVQLVSARMRCSCEIAKPPACPPQPRCRPLRARKDACSHRRRSSCCSSDRSSTRP